MAERPASPERELNLTRLAWIVSILTPLALISLLFLVKVASSAAAEEEPFESSEAPLVSEECIEWEEGVIECEPAEEAAPADAAPEECLLRSARARVIQASEGRLRLIVHYRAVIPTRAYVELRMRTGGETFSLGLVRRPLGRSGRLRLNETLSAEGVKRARGARDFLVTLDLPSAPDHCRGRLTLRLSERRTIRGHSVWIEPSEG
jgi:hypothetical protein